ncbi:3787_t:CDS:2, partial [Cetraspora pellucida]
GIFSESMFDAQIIELEQLVDNIECDKICEVWHITSVDKKANHLVYIDQSSTLSNEHVIILVLDEEFGSTEINAQVNFSHLENIHSCHIFTDK